MTAAADDTAADATAPDRRAGLPQVDVVLRRPELAGQVTGHGHRVVAEVARDHLDVLRRRIRDGEDVDTDPAAVASAVAARLVARDRGRLRRVVNATGVVLHTNLGRAPLSDEARAAVADAAGATTLEYDLATGARGSRTAHVGGLLSEACGTEAALAVNNGAAALLLTLAALAGDREVIVSRGELIEIGGSYRLPEIMRAAGCRLVEVGTTNRTRLADYRDAVTDDTALLLKVHRSNFAVVGFTEEVAPAPLATLGRECGVPVVHDVGSGLLHDAPTGPLRAEPSVAASVRAGVDLVVFSGDKLLGGPQAGVVAGRGALVEACRRHPFARAVRIDKLQRAALEATVAAHLREPVPLDVPTVAMLHADPDDLRGRAEAVAARLGPASSTGTDVEVVALTATVGGGALPGAELPSWGVAVRASTSPGRLAAALRAGDPPVVARVEEGRVVLDLRTVPPAQDDEVVACVRAALDSTPA